MPKSVTAISVPAQSVLKPRAEAMAIAHTLTLFGRLSSYEIRRVLNCVAAYYNWKVIDA